MPVRHAKSVWNPLAFLAGLLGLGALTALVKPPFKAWLSVDAAHGWLCAIAAILVCSFVGSILAEKALDDLATVRVVHPTIKAEFRPELNFNAPKGRKLDVVLIDFSGRLINEGLNATRVFRPEVQILERHGLRWRALYLEPLERYWRVGRLFEKETGEGIEVEPRTDHALTLSFAVEQAAHLLDRRLTFRMRFRILGQEDYRLLQLFSVDTPYGRTR